MKLIRFLMPAFLLFIGTAVFAQSYKTAAGLRIGHGIHPSIQQHIHDKWTAEGILHTNFNTSDLGITLLAEQHHKILFRGFNFYYGAGGHYYWKSASNRVENEVSNNVYGLSFIGGAEMTIGKLNVSVDFKPELHFGGDQTFPLEWTGLAVSVRHVLIKREKKKMSDWSIWEGKKK
jgi:hypothetical protein